MKKTLVMMLLSTTMILSLTACSILPGSKKDTEVSFERDSSSETTERITSRIEPAEPEETEPAEEVENVEEGVEEVIADLSEEEGKIVASHSTGKSAAKALAKLLSGNAEYVSGNVNPDVSDSLRTDLAENGQHPYAIIITCSDSRVPAELIFNASLGDIFVIRTAGNVVSDFEIGSVEYGAEHLGSPLIFVLGHSNCGAVTAATEGGEAGGKIQSIVDEIKPSVNKAKETETEESEILSKAIELNVNNSISRLMESHILKELTEEGKAEIIGGIYDIHTGHVKIVE